MSRRYLDRSLSDAPVNLGFKEGKTMAATTAVRRKTVVLGNRVGSDEGKGVEAGLPAVLFRITIAPLEGFGV